MNKRNRIWFASSLLCIACTLSACAPAITAPAPSAIPLPSLSPVPILQPTATQSIPSILSALPNANYPIEVTSSHTAQLKDGLFEEAAAPGSSSKITVSLDKNQVEGDLNGDGIPDAAVTLTAETGGSGTFTYLAAVINKNGAAEPLNSVLLGDRIIVKSLSIQSGQIEVDFLDHALNEALAAAPTLQVVKKFKVQDNQLVEVK